MNIQGWFDFPGFYSEIARWVPEGGQLLECGVWRGASLLYLANELHRLGKTNVTIHAVDSWKGSDEEIHRKIIEELGGEDKLFEDFLENIRKSGLNNIEVHRMESVQAAKQFEDKSLNFVFIDAEHTEKSLTQDIRAWLPKIRHGGILSGHDWDHPPVQKCVKDHFGGDCRVVGSCWVVQCDKPYYYFQR